MLALRPQETLGRQGSIVWSDDDAYKLRELIDYRCDGVLSFSLLLSRVKLSPPVLRYSLAAAANESVWSRDG